MREPVVDYKKLNLHNITSPEYRHVLLLLGWVVYFLLYFVTENFIPDSACHLMHSKVDDLIPFCEYFVIFYCFWYILCAGSLLNYLLYDVDRFKKLQIFIMITQGVAMLVYIVYPSIQDLRPATFERQNFCTWVMGIIYDFDTPTGVCPSLHVAYTFGIVSTLLKDPRLATWKKILFFVLGILICLATMFCKQHSFIDVCWGFVLGAFTEAIVYGRWWVEKLRPARQKA